MVLAWVASAFLLTCGVFEWRIVASGGAWWLSPVLCGVLYLLLVPASLTRMRVLGSTVLVETGVEVRLAWRRRRVAWHDVAAIEVQRREMARGSSFHVANLRTTSGRQRPLRGMFGGSSVELNAPFWNGLEQARAAWERATGATEPVQMRE